MRRVLLEVVLDLLLELDEAHAVLALLAHQETLPSLVLELELQADILGCPNQSLVTEWLLVVLDLHLFQCGHDLALVPCRELLLLPWVLLSLRLSFLQSSWHPYYRQV